MDLPFKPVAAPSPEPAFQKRLVVSDWGGTILIAENGQTVPNKPLYLLLTLAAKKGHDVVIASKGESQSIRDMLGLHADMTGIEIPAFQVERKQALANVMRAQGHEKAFIAFDDEPEEVRGVHNDTEQTDGYIKADFIGEVDYAGRIEDITAFAAMLGVKEEFEARLPLLSKNTAPPRSFGIR